MIVSKPGTGIGGKGMGGDRSLRIPPPATLPDALATFRDQRRSVVWWVSRGLPLVSLVGLRPGKKRPIGFWLRSRYARMAETGLPAWDQHLLDAGAGIGVLCGAVSGILDREIESPFLRVAEALGGLPAGCVAYRSPSGGVHTLGRWAWQDDLRGGPLRVTFTRELAELVDFSALRAKGAPKNPDTGQPYASPAEMVGRSIAIGDQLGEGYLTALPPTANAKGRYAFLPGREFGTAPLVERDGWPSWFADAAPPRAADAAPARRPPGSYVDPSLPSDLSLPFSLPPAPVPGSHTVIPRAPKPPPPPPAPSRPAPTPPPEVPTDGLRFGATSDPHVVAARMRSQILDYLRHPRERWEYPRVPGQRSDAIFRIAIEADQVGATYDAIESLIMSSPIFAEKIDEKRTADDRHWLRRKVQGARRESEVEILDAFDLAISGLTWIRGDRDGDPQLRLWITWAADRDAPPVVEGDDFALTLSEIDGTQISPRSVPILDPCGRLTGDARQLMRIVGRSWLAHAAQLALDRFPTVRDQRGERLADKWSPPVDEDIGVHPGDVLGVVLREPRERDRQGRRLISRFVAAGSGRGHFFRDES